VLRQEVGEVLLAGLFEDGQVAAVDHPQPARAPRRPAGGNCGFSSGAPPVRSMLRMPGIGGDEIEHGIDGFGRHLLGALAGPALTWQCMAALVAAVAEVELQGLDPCGVAGRESRSGSAGAGWRACAFLRGIPAWSGLPTEPYASLWQKNSARRFEAAPPLEDCGAGQPL
jgi:hypothetical protein